MECVSKKKNNLSLDHHEEALGLGDWLRAEWKECEGGELGGMFHSLNVTSHGEETSAPAVI